MIIQIKITEIIIVIMILKNSNIKNNYIEELFEIKV